MLIRLTSLLKDAGRARSEMIAFAEKEALARSSRK
jgi:hypothetical protein